MSHLVICATQLETEHRKKVFTLQHNPTFQPITSVDGMGEWCFGDNVVNSRCEDQSEILHLISNSFEYIAVHEMILTSGCPFGSKNASGTSHSGCEPFLSPKDAIGVAEYSVNDKVFRFGLQGEESPLVDAISGIFKTSGTDVVQRVISELNRNVPVNRES